MTTTVAKSVTVSNSTGIHLRPADILSRAANRFACKIEIEKDGQAVDCKSIMSILSLGAQQGQVLHLRATGEDAQAAVETLAELFEEGFDQSDSELASPGQAG